MVITGWTEPVGHVLYIKDQGLIFSINDQADEVNNRFILPYMVFFNCRQFCNGKTSPEFSLLFRCRYCCFQDDKTNFLSAHPEIVAHHALLKTQKQICILFRGFLIIFCSYFVIGKI